MTRRRPMPLPLDRAPGQAVEIRRVTDADGIVREQVVRVPRVRRRRPKKTVQHG